MAEVKTTGPVLFCYDGSQGSRNAMRAAGDLIGRPTDAVVLTIWETIATRLALAGAFTAGLSTGGSDSQRGRTVLRHNGGRGRSAPRQRARVPGLSID